MINSSETAFHFFDALPGSLFQRSAHSHSGLDHTFMLIPATPPCLIPDRRRKRHNEPGTLALNVFTLYRMPIPYVTAYFQQSSDRKSTRLNSSHVKRSYAVFCLKKKNHNLQG